MSDSATLQMIKKEMKDKAYYKTCVQGIRMKF